MDNWNWRDEGFQLILWIDPFIKRDFTFMSDWVRQTLNPIILSECTTPKSWSLPRRLLNSELNGIFYAKKDTFGVFYLLEFTCRPVHSVVVKHFTTLQREKVKRRRMSTSRLIVSVGVWTIRFSTKETNDDGRG